MPKVYPSIESFSKVASLQNGNIIPMYRRLMGDQLTPVIVYRRLVRPDDRMAPSFLLESVEGGDRVARYSFIGAQPTTQVIAHGNEVEIFNDQGYQSEFTSPDPLAQMRLITKDWNLARDEQGSAVHGLPDFTGGWVGFAGYDTVRYHEGEKLKSPPEDDRNLPDLHMALYRQVIAFDHVQKTLIVITNVNLDEHDSPESAYEQGKQELDILVQRIQTQPQITPGSVEIAVGEVDLNTPPPKLTKSNMPDGAYQAAVEKAKQYIGAGDIFQVVPSQRFEMITTADPFEIYRALRVVNPSPYMFYLQIQGGMLVGSSPEILCRVQNGQVTNKPLAGTRIRGKDEAQDLALEKDLLQDPKERAEHIMLVDLGRNDVGRVSELGTVQWPKIMEIERYSHVMHISSTVTGTLLKGMDCWDALKYALPVGTVSGAPKVRAMQIIDELEPTRRGPYAGAVGYADYAGNMDMAIALRTMVVMPQDDGKWKVHLQAGAGVVADSNPDAEHEETQNKAAALAKAVELAEVAFE